MKNRIKQFRRSRTTLSQRALAQRVGVSRQTINAIEKGDQTPSLDLAFRIAGVFGLAIEEVWTTAESAQAVVQSFIA